MAGPETIEQKTDNGRKAEKSNNKTSFYMAKTNLNVERGDRKDIRIQHATETAGHIHSHRPPLAQRSRRIWSL